MYNRYLRNDDGVYTRMPMQDAPRTTNRSTSKTSATKAAPMGVTLRFLIPLHSLLSFRQNQALKSAGRSLRRPKCHKIASAMRAQAWPSP